MNCTDLVKKTVLLILLFAFNTGFLLSQSNLFERGYVILNSGDTLFGFIKDLMEREDLYLSVTISDNQAGANPLTYTPYEVNEYYYEPGYCFVSRDNDLPDNPGKIFLQCLVKGYASLYFYKRVERSVYIIEKEGEPALILEGQPGTRLMDQNSGEKLRDFISDCAKLTEKGYPISCKGEDLIRMIKLYNRCSMANQEVTIYKLGKERLFRVGVTTGVNLSDLQVHADIHYQDARLKLGLGFNVGVGFEIYFLERFSLNVKAIWASYNASLWDYPVFDKDTSFREDDVLFNFSYLDFPVELKVNLTSKRIKTFVFGGIWYGVLVEQDIAVQSTMPERSGVYPMNLDKLKRGYAGGIGIAIPSNRRSEISFEIGYIYQKASAGNSDGFTLQNYFLQMSYLF